MNSIIFISIISFLLGLLTNYFINNVVSKFKQLKKKELIESYFKEINNGVKSGLSNFVTRVNNIVVISFKMIDFGDVSITYNIESKETQVLKDNKEILTSSDVSLSEKLKLSRSIEEVHGTKIKDVVDVFGHLLNREEFEQSMKETVEKVKNMLGDLPIEIETKHQFNIDDILDRISQVGIENLTDEEKEFLKKYNK